MQSYLNIVRTVLEHGEMQANRTGVAAKTVLGQLFQHDMGAGFPLLTTKKVHFHSVKVELEFFLRGKTQKSWLRERGCTIWDEWANPLKTSHIENPRLRAEAAKREDDLGPIYGSQWRNFSANYGNASSKETLCEKNNTKNALPTGVDQLQLLLNEIEKNPSSRRLIVSAWNPLAMPAMALPPCHVLFNVNVQGEKIHLTWYQRSCDLMLGIPFNIASYALLLHLLAKHAKRKAGMLTGMWNDVHIYENHFKGAAEQLERTPTKLPQIKTSHFTSIFNWKYSDSEIVNYTPQSRIAFPIAV